MAGYADPDTQMGGGPGQYANQNGTPPAQQHQLTDPELRLQENLQQLREGGDMMHPAGPQQPQYQQMAHMDPPWARISTSQDRHAQRILRNKWRNMS